MIGIPILDNLSEVDLCLVATGRKIIHVIEKYPIQLISVLTPIQQLHEPPSQQFELMDNDKVITLCKMEIESRLGWIYLHELIEKSEK